MDERLFNERRLHYEDHTLTHFRSEYYFSPLANRLNAPTWEAAGASDALTRAALTVREILSAPPKTFLDEHQAREVQKLLAQAEEVLANLEVHV